MIFGEKPPKIVCSDPEITIDLSALGANSSFTEYNYCIPDYILHTSVKTGKRQLLQRGITDKHYAGFKIKIWGLNIGDYETKYKSIDGKVVAFTPHADLLSSFNCIVLNVKPYYKNSMNFKDAVIITLISESYYEPSVIIRDGLVGYWPLYKIYYKDGKILDLSGYENHGTFYGEPNPIFVPDHNGKPDSAISFDGENDYINCGNDESLNITNAITIGYWFKVINFDISHTFISKKYNEWEIRVYTTKRVQFYKSDGAGGYEYHFPNVSFVNNKWYHMVSTFLSSNKEWKTYVNGQLKDTYNCDSGSLSNPANSDVWIGARSGGNYYFKGFISDVRIYSRILGIDEIKKIHQRQG